MHGDSQAVSQGLLGPGVILEKANLSQGGDAKLKPWRCNARADELPKGWVARKEFPAAVERCAGRFFERGSWLKTRDETPSSRLFFGDFSARTAGQRGAHALTPGKDQRDLFCRAGALRRVYRQGATVGGTHEELVFEREEVFEE
jgi:hypothetical protein